MKWWNVVQLYGKDNLKARFDYDSGTVPVYIGFAVPGTATSATAGWQILKMTYDGNDNVTAIDFAESHPGFGFEWDERASYTYG